MIVVQSYNVSSDGRGLLETASVLRRHRHEVIAKFDRPYYPRWTGGLSRYFPDGIQYFHKRTLLGWHNCTITP